jgi:TolB-like protein/tetratricopeptide (TPR) repeat protein
MTALLTILAGTGLHGLADDRAPPAQPFAVVFRVIRISAGLQAMAEQSFFTELRKRKVFQVAAIYGAVAWGVTEVVVTVVEQLFLPQWVSTLAVIGFVVGFPIAMFLAWTFDITPEGIHRTRVTSRRGKASIALSMVLLVAATTGLFFLIWSPRPPAVDPHSVAVLPFDSAGPDSQDTDLIQGVSDALRDQLGRVSGIPVAARQSSIVAKERGLDAKTIGATLGVAHIIEGSMRRRGKSLLVSVHLIDGQTGLALWTRTFDSGPVELLTIQQSIADEVVPIVLPGTVGAVAELATNIAIANEALMKARYFEQQVRARPDVDFDMLQQAIHWYRKATETDEKSALAWSRLAGTLMYLGDLDAAAGPIFRALELDPNLSEVQNTKGEFYWGRGESNDAGEAWARAVELNPNNPDALANYALWCWMQARTEHVEEMYRRALRWDQLNLERFGALGTFLALENQEDAARDLIEQVKTTFDGATAFRLIAELFDYLGDVDQSIAWTIKARDLEQDNPSHTEKLAEYYIDIGDFDTAEELDPELGLGLLFKMRRYAAVIDTGGELMLDQPNDMPIVAILAFAFNATGDFDNAIRVLTSIGLPDSALKGYRSLAEWDGFIALMNALDGVGETETARDLAQFGIDFGHTEGRDWWQTVAEACQRAVAGKDDEAREFLERAQKSARLAWDPVLKDSPCFKRFADDPVYRETLRVFDERRKKLRERLPATLKEFGVSL